MAEIVTYRAELRAAFERLNREFLESRWTLEPNDVRLLRDPFRAFVSTGGEVFFLLEGGEALGTCALRREGVDLSGAPLFELCKMAVAPTSRGKGYGDLLVAAAVEAARARGARQVFLLTHSTLSPAIALYEKHGFRITRRGTPPVTRREHRRADLEMTLELPVPRDALRDLE
jgi:ribosomal protein S18 acetylase RimI-like enzyme